MTIMLILWQEEFHYLSSFILRKSSKSIKWINIITDKKFWLFLFNVLTRRWNWSIRYDGNIIEQTILQEPFLEYYSIFPDFVGLFVKCMLLNKRQHLCFYIFDVDNIWMIYLTFLDNYFVFSLTKEWCRRGQMKSQLRKYFDFSDWNWSSSSI